MTKVIQVYAPLPSVTRGKPVHIGYNDHNKMGTHIVYPTGNCIVIKNVNNPLDTDIYYEHTSETTCAKYSPSGYYICSGDVQGNVRIWDTTQKEHPLKFSFKALSGPIYDIAWTGDSQRICVVGEGKEKLGSVFMWDAGSSVGEISGQTKTLLSCDFRGTRPFRLITTGEDNYPCWFEGPPFKFKKSMKDIHSRFINCARFSPDGSLCVCVSSDKSISVFDGKTGEMKYKKTEHKAGVYSVTWGNDSKTFITASADKTCKVWNAEDGSVIKTIEFENTIEQQQLGVVNSKNGIICVSLNGSMHNIEESSGDIKEVIEGHNKPITALSNDGEYLYSGSNEGHVVRWEKASGKAVGIRGKGHCTRINDIVNCGDKVATLGSDDCVKILDKSLLEYEDSISTESPANCGVYYNNTLYVGTNKGIKVIQGKEIIQSINHKNGVATLAMNGDKTILSAGIKSEGCIKFYSINNEGRLTEKGEIKEDIQGTVYSMDYSSDGKYFVHSDDTRKIVLRDAKTNEVIYSRWVPHNSKVLKLRFNKDNTMIGTAGADSYSYVLNVETKGITPLGRVHPLGVNDIFIDEDGKIFTCGADSTIKVSSL
ncbi:hypothetical protein ENUP19_0057G0084 [Entamoeba nuttalli]|uniref:WD domain, G-beta repeat-containing protein n=1 Tax=Entamoeba nuttalli TaxID=412467 RepID=A0ABQ0DD19_9EUKA